MHSRELRVAANRMYLKNCKSIRKIAHMLDVSKSTIHRWITSCPLIQKQRRKRKTTTCVVDTIIRALSTNPTYTCKQLSSIVKQQCSTQISSSSVHCVIKQNGFSRKRVTLRTNTSFLDTKRQDFRMRIKCIPEDSVISIDETYFHVQMLPKYGYSKRGSRCSVPTSTCRPKAIKVSLVMAVSNSGIIGWKAIVGNINTESFTKFIKELSIPDASYKYAMMDNVIFHKSQSVKDALKSKNLDSLFIPPYSPFFNPIEHVFSFLKQRFRSLWYDYESEIHVHNGVSLLERVERCISYYEQSNLQRVFAHCWCQ